MSVYGPLLVCKHTDVGREVRLLTYIRPLTAAPLQRYTGPDGLFARQIPIAPTGLAPLDISGFFRRRFDLLAIARLA